MAMVAHIRTVAFQGIEAVNVEVQVQISSGLPAFTLVGLPDKAVAESRERVRAAIQSMGLALPARRITVNLAPADLQKEGSHFDLPIALGILVGMGVLPSDALDEYVVLGELSLDSRVLPISGVLPAAIHANAQGRGIICPKVCGSEAVWAGDLSVLAVPSLVALINHFKGTQLLAEPSVEAPEIVVPSVDMKDIRGQLVARRALEIAAAGGHNLLMSGPPGTGKSMLAACLAGILPPLTAKEMLEVSMIHSVSGALGGKGLQQVRPYRAPHHSTSIAAMVGGGRNAKPGEISLAHHGVLFLDELPEFARTTLESLRQPLEAGVVTVARANAHVTYPASFQLVAAMNPCKCGYLSDANLACNKAPKCAQDYQSRISGPLLDRIDMHIDMPMINTLDMLAKPDGESSADVALRVAAARELQLARAAQHGAEHMTTNARMQGEMLEKLAMPDAAGKQLLEKATLQFKLSVRGYTRILRVARTIADLEGSAQVCSSHIAEALSYRQMHHHRIAVT